MYNITYWGDRCKKALFYILHLSPSHVRDQFGESTDDVRFSMFRRDNLISGMRGVDYQKKSDTFSTGALTQGYRRTVAIVG